MGYIGKKFLLLAPLLVVITMLSSQNGVSAQSSVSAPGSLLLRSDVQNSKAGKPVPNQYIVTLRTKKGIITDPSALAEKYEIQYGGQITHTYDHALRGFSLQLSATNASDELNALKSDPRVASVVPNVWLTANSVQANAPWSIDRIDQRVGLNQQYAYNANGTGVDVYIVDSGIRISHSQFGDRARYGINKRQDRVNLDGTLNEINAGDCFGHGTHVAGLAGGSTYGVAKNADLIAVRVLDCEGFGSTAEIVDGIDWVTEQKDADRAAGRSTPMVANMSLGCGRGVPCNDATHKLLKDAIAKSVTVGVSYVVAVGNDFGGDACTYSAGAGIANVINVSATDNADKVASYADLGRCVDVFAPGGEIPEDYVPGNAVSDTIGIRSAWIKGENGLLSDTATKVEVGTSMAAPLVTGVAALYLETHPAATPEAVKTAVVNTATPEAVTKRYGNRPNSDTTHALVYSRLTTPAPAPLSAPTITRSGTTLTLHPGAWSTVSDPVATAYQWRYTSVYAGGSTGHPICPTYPDGTGWVNVGSAATTTVTTTDEQHCWSVTERKTNQSSGEFRDATSNTYQLVFTPPTLVSNPTITRNGGTLTTDGGSWTITDPVRATYVWHYSYYTGGVNGHGYCASGYPGLGNWHDIVTSGPSVAITGTEQVCWAVTVLKENSGGGDSGSSDVFQVTFSMPVPVSNPTITRSGTTLSVTGGSWTTVPDSVATSYQWRWSDYAGYSNGTPYCPAGTSVTWTNAGTSTSQTAAGAQRCWLVVERKTNAISNQFVDATSAVYLIATATSMPTLVSAPTITRSGTTLSTDGGAWSGGDPTNTTYQWLYTSTYAGSYNGHPYCPAYPSGSGWTNAGSGAVQATNDDQHCWVVVVTKTHTVSGETRQAVSGGYQLAFSLPTLVSNPTITLNGTTLSTDGGVWSGGDPVTTSYYWQWGNYAGGVNGHGYCYPYPSAGHWTGADAGSTQTKTATQPCWVLMVTKSNSGGSVTGTSMVTMVG